MRSFCFFALGFLCACHDNATTTPPENDGGVEPTYMALGLSYQRTDPKFTVTGDGATLTVVGPKALTVLKASTWDLVVPAGSTQTTVSAGSAADINGVTYQASICGDLVAALSACNGEVSCWNGMATVPSGAQHFTCQTPTTPGDCAKVSTPTDVALMGVPGFLYVYRSGISVAMVEARDANTLEIAAYSDTKGDGVLLTSSGQITDQYPQNNFDWKASLTDTRNAVNAHGAWTYSETTCTGSVTHTMCNIMVDEFSKCVAAVVDGAAAGPCLSADSALQTAVGGNPYGFAATCQ